MTLPDPARPVITTERFDLWIPGAEDIPGMLALLSHPETHRFLGPMGTPGSHMSRILRNVGSWVVYGYGLLVVKHRGDPAPIGNCGIFHTHRDLGADFDDRPEAGWIIAAEHAGQGVASEVMEAILRWFDTERGGEIMCMIDPDNAPSLRLADKFGFAPLRVAEMPDGDTVRLFRRPPPAK
ncbi:GNAT family N-acetyltransferase [Aurantiacibacter sp. D1-12]|uniref:GNAT family N-acetyltransferase n=1 Tax=Aurantiacibacter sp. D1-12 TaxID=2993658 RepID=UPI00237D19FA|nr:GNAT family N-acetyltransferase [Aurantiacibacter sp. D1-12]MDE1468195.1 GNAT family N-acetyltransferase [Aurantiacibacter sp. D1-12]